MTDTEADRIRRIIEEAFSNLHFTGQFVHTDKLVPIGTAMSEAKASLAQSLLKELTKARQETAKAFGGCMACYGKGYATAIESTLSRFGHRTHNNIKFCSCERGKQLKAHLKREAGGNHD